MTFVETSGMFYEAFSSIFEEFSLVSSGIGIYKAILEASDNFWQSK